MGSSSLCCSWCTPIKFPIRLCSQVMLIIRRLCFHIKVVLGDMRNRPVCSSELDSQSISGAVAGSGLFIQLLVCPLPGSQTHSSPDCCLFQICTSFNPSLALSPGVREFVKPFVQVQGPVFMQQFIPNPPVFMFSHKWIFVFYFTHKVLPTLTMPACLYAPPICLSSFFFFLILLSTV